MKNTVTIGYGEGSTTIGYADTLREAVAPAESQGIVVESAQEYPRLDYVEYQINFD